MDAEFGEERQVSPTEVGGSRKSVSLQQARCNNGFLVSVRMVSQRMRVWHSQRPSSTKGAGSPI